MRWTFEGIDHDLREIDSPMTLGVFGSAGVSFPMTSLSVFRTGSRASLGRKWATATQKSHQAAFLFRYVSAAPTPALQRARSSAGGNRH
jgi:hypothetical protein